MTTAWATDKKCSRSAPTHSMPTATTTVSATDRKPSRSAPTHSTPTATTTARATAQRSRRGRTRSIRRTFAKVAQAHVEVVGPGNPADSNGLGAVAYEYPISQHEVTVREYVSFLNAVADTDAYGLFEENPAHVRELPAFCAAAAPAVSPTARHPIERTRP